MSRSEVSASSEQHEDPFSLNSSCINSRRCGNAVRNGIPLNQEYSTVHPGDSCRRVCRRVVNPPPSARFLSARLACLRLLHLYRNAVVSRIGPALSRETFPLNRNLDRRVPSLPFSESRIFLRPFEHQGTKGEFTLSRRSRNDCCIRIFLSSFHFRAENVYTPVSQN